MDSKTIVERYGAKLKGQQRLFEDDDLVLRNTKFKSINPEFDKEALVHFWMNVYMPEDYGDGKTPYEIYKTWSNGMWKCFRYIKTDGYRPDTNQSHINVMCYKKTPLEPQLAELAMWLPHIKPGRDENGRGERQGKHVGIFESSLSAGGVFGMTIYSDTEVVIGKVTYGSYRDIKEFDGVASAVDYIRNNLWYDEEE